MMTRKLGLLAEIRSGYPFRSSVPAQARGTVRVIQIKDVDPEHGIRIQDLASIDLDRPGSYLVRQGDLLYLARGERPFAVVVSEPIESAIATGFFFIVRPDPHRVRPDYLAWWLNGADFLAEIRRRQRGTQMRLVSKADFQEMTVPVPPLETQDRIAALDGLLRRERRLLDALQRTRAALVAAVGRRAALQDQE
jgi:hypothetical protein